MQKLQDMNILQTHLLQETERGGDLHNPHIISARENIKYLKEWDVFQAHYNHYWRRREQYTTIAIYTGNALH